MAGLSRDEVGPEGPSPSWLQRTLRQQGWCQCRDARLMLQCFRAHLCGCAPLGTSPVSVTHQKTTNPTEESR